MAIWHSLYKDEIKTWLVTGLTHIALDVSMSVVLYGLCNNKIFALMIHEINLVTVATDETNTNSL